MSELGPCPIDQPCLIPTLDLRDAIRREHELPTLGDEPMPKDEAMERIAEICRKIEGISEQIAKVAAGERGDETWI